TKSGYLWDTNQQEAIEKGNLVHNMMSFIKTKEDIDFVINDFISASLIDEKQALLLKSKIIDIVNHPMLEPYFNTTSIIYNERDIISKHGIIIRPDRVIISTHGEVVIMDYKSGKEDKGHLQQLLSYQNIIEEMNLKVIYKILIYINDNVIVRIV